MVEYMRTVLNGLKAWLTGEASKLRTKIKSVEAAVVKAANTASKAASAAAQNKKDIAAMSQDLDWAYDAANAAQSTANAAQSTANAAQSTANAAQSTANAAQSTANAAQSTADTIAERYDAAHAMIGKNAKNTSGPRFAGVYIRGGYESDDDADNFEFANSITLGSEDSSVINSYEVINMRSSHKSHIGNHNIAQLIFSGHRAVNSNYMMDGVEIAGLSSIVLNSSDANSTKKFRITVNDYGTLSATEVTS